MSNYIKMVDCSEEELMHYGVLGMKWHHHMAKKYYNKAALEKRKTNMHMDNAIKTLDSNRKATRNELINAAKTQRKADKYMQSHNKYVDKMNAGFDENRDKVMKSKKYSTLQKQIDNANDAKAAYKKSLERGDYNDTFEADEKWVAKAAKLNESLGMSKRDAYDMAVDEASENGAGKWRVDTNRYNSDVNSQDKVINKAQKAQNKMTNKVEKKRKKYVTFAY